VHQYPAVIVHGATDARLALSVGLPVTLLSAPGAALYAGCAWWSALVRQAHAEFPAATLADILDCGDGAGAALAALRIGQQFLVLSRLAPAWNAVAAIASAQGGKVLESAPPALNLDHHGARRRLADWLAMGTTPGDSAPPLG
jgi:hypothetical protein